MGNFASAVVDADGTVSTLIPCLAVVLVQMLCYVFCQIKEDNSYIDILWSFTCLLPNIVIISAKLALGQPIDARTWAVNACLAVWAARLFYHFAARHTGEDYRYIGLRERISACGPAWYYINAFVFIFMLQAGLAILVTFTTTRLTAYSSVQTYVTNGGVQDLVWSDYVGLAMFVIGFVIEVVADAQLKAHIADPDPTKGKYLKAGLWRYSRHPNYFGESLLWWGFYICSLAVPDGYKTVFSPIIITFLIRCVAGVPLLERKARLHPEWAQYEAETNTFIPWFWDQDAEPVHDDSFRDGQEDTE